MKKTILIVDDEEHMRNAMERKLETELFVLLAIPQKEIKTFKEAAITIVKQIEIDLVLLDIEFPGEIGFEIAKAIKEIKNVPIVLMSGNFEAIECEGRFAKYKDYLQYADKLVSKPLEKNFFEEVVKKLLEKR